MSANNTESGCVQSFTSSSFILTSREAICDTVHDRSTMCISKSFIVRSADSVQIASHKIIFVFMQKFSMFLNSIKLHLVLSVTTRHRAF